MFGVAPGGTLLPEVEPYRGAHELRIGVKNDEILSWIDASSFIENLDGENNRFAVYGGPDVNVGGELTLSWDLKIAADATDGTYNLYTGMVREFDAWAQQVTVSGAPIPGDIFWRVVIGEGTVAPTPDPAAGGLTVSLASGNPAAGQVPQNATADLIKLAFTASSTGDVSISKVGIMRSGLSDDADVDNIRIFTSEGIQKGSTGTLNANHKAVITLTDPLVIPSGTTVNYWVRVGIDSAADAGHRLTFSVDVDSDITSDATSVSGTPVVGNVFEVVAVTIGTATIDADTAVSDTTPDIGDTDVVLNTFKITAGAAEPIIVETIWGLEAGTASLNDLENIELWSITGNKSLGELNWDAQGQATWVLSPVINIAKGETHRFQVRADILDGSSLTANIDLLDGSTNLFSIKGGTYGYYITPTSGATWTTNGGKGASNQTIAAGSVNVSKTNTVPTGNIAVASNQEIASFNLDIRGESIKITQWLLDLKTGAGIATDMFTNVAIYDENGSIVAGPKDGAETADGTDEVLTFTDTIIVETGMHEFIVKANIGSTDTANNDTIAVESQDASTTTNLTITGMNTNSSITATPAADVAGNTRTIKTATLSVTTLALPVAQSVAAGTQDFVWATAALDAGSSGEDIQITSMVWEDTLNAVGDDFNDMQNVAIWADFDSNGTYEVQISKEETMTDGAVTDETKTFTGFIAPLVVPKGTTVKVALIGDLSSGADANDKHTWSVDTDASDVTCSGVDTGSDISADVTPSGAGQQMINVANGTLTLTLDSSAPLASLLVGNSSKVLVTVWRFTAAAIEGIRIDDIALEDGSTAQDDTMHVYLYADRNSTGAQVDHLTNLIADGVQTAADTTYYMNSDTALRPVVPADSYIRIYAYVDTSPVSGGVANGDKIRFNIDDVSADVNCTGINSGGSFDPAGSDGRDGGDHELYKSIPTVTVSPLSPAGNLTLSTTAEVAVFRITADAADDITFDDGDYTTMSIQIDAYTTDYIHGSTSAIQLDNKTDGVKVASPSAADIGSTLESKTTQVDFTFEDNSGATDALTIPAGSYKDLAVKVDTTKFEDAGDAITVWLDDTDADFTWGINGSGAYATGDISFRGDNIRANTLIKA